MNRYNNENKKYVTVAFPIIMVSLVIFLFFASNLWSKAKAKDTGKKDKPVRIQKKSGFKLAGINLPTEGTEPGDMNPPCRAFRNYSELDPFTEMRQMHDNMERLFANTFNRFRLSPGFNSKDHPFQFMPQVDLCENKDAYSVRLDVPGVKKSDLKIMIEGNVLIVSGKRDARHDTVKCDEVISSERSHGEFVRSVALSGGFDKKKIKAECKDGVLTITIPKNNTPSQGEFTVKID